MNKSLAKVLGLVVVIAMCVAPFAGCTSPTAAPATSAPVAASSAPAATATPVVDISTPVELQCWMLGDAPKDLQLVMDKVNEITKAQLNSTEVWNFTTWTDTPTKYALLLTSGQKFDLIYTATWREFWKWAQQGAFNPLEVILPKVAPDLFAHEGDTVLKQATVKGHVATVPCTYKEYITNGISYRADLSTIIPDSLANVEAYLLDVKAKHPDQTELTLEGPSTGSAAVSFSAMEAIQGLEYKSVNTMASSGLSYGLQADYATPSQIKPYWGTPEFAADMKLMKKWADEGLWSPSALAQAADANAFDNGRIVMIMSGENLVKYSQHMTKIASAHPDWKVGYYNYALTSHLAIPAHPCQNGYGEPLSVPNPERALLYLQMLVMDKTVNQLQEYGIPGVHYTVTADGHYDVIGDATKSGFAREAMNGWGYRNEDYMLYDQSFDLVKAYNATLNPSTVMNITDGFIEDYTPYEGERGALTNVMTEKLAPLEAGLASTDVDTAIADFMTAANAAGLQDIQTQYIAQWKAYVSSLGLS
jgi:putative aldouronate transport system substrate-binding protein